MREIVFRGKRVANGEWVFGCLSYSYDGTAIITFKDEERGLTGDCVVDPATIGEYTGLTNEFGQKIFEGDILKRECPIYELGKREPTGSRYVFGDVYWSAPEGHPGHWVIRATDEHGQPMSYIFDSTWRVVGNIHDNPELSKTEGNV